MTAVLRRGARGNLIEFLTRGYTGLLGGLNVVAAIFIFILMLLVSADVVGRYVFNRPLYGTFEIAESLLVFIVFLGFAYTQHEKGNIRVQVLANRLPLRVRSLLDVVAHALGLAIFALITYEAGRHAIEAWRIGEESVGMVRIPLWPSRFAVPVGSFFLAIQFTIDAWSDLKRFVRG